MANEKPKVNFHGKEMNLLEARLYVYGLKAGIVNINLSEEEDRQYLKLLNIERNRNELAKKIVGKTVRKEPTKRDYLISLLERKIDAAKVLKEMEYCKEHGHKEMKGSSYTPPGVEGAVTHYTCSRCRRIYEKESNSFKDKNSNEKVHNPFSI